MTPLFLEMFDFENTVDPFILHQRIKYNSLNLGFVFNFQRKEENTDYEQITFVCASERFTGEGTQYRL